MRRGVDVVRATHDDVRSDLSKLRNVVDDLVAQGWKGKASAGFTEVMGEWDRNADKLLNAMSRIADLMQTSGQTFTINDEEQQNLMQKTRDYSGVLGQRL
jgi:WXG100 family type VII secretion target